MKEILKYYGDALTELLACILGIVIILVTFPFIWSFNVRQKIGNFFLNKF